MVKITYDFSGTVALVTGAASGIGLATARAFASAGAKVVLSDVDGGALDRAVADLRANRFEATGLICDVSDDASVERLIADAVGTYGRLDAAFNNAGIVPPMTNIADMAEEDFDRVIAINLKGVWSSMKYELRQMMTQGSGTIVNCSSMAGRIGAPGRAGYIAAKHGIIGLTRGAAMEGAPHGIRVNAVCPGTIDTPTVERMARENDLVLEAAANAAALARLGSADEIADAVLWLCSPSSTYVVGQSLSVDGGVVM